jgi:anti-sigma factor RsiW
MSCEHTQALLDGYLDAELDAEKSLKIEQHLNTCPACREFHEARQEMRAAIKSQARYFTAPDLIERRLHEKLDRAENAVSRRGLPFRWMGLAATAAFAALLGAGGTLWIGKTSTEDLLAREVVANHSRSLMVAGRITDISSSDQHAVKPWFNGRIDYSPPVVDLTAKGFALVGGRLDYLDNRPVAALVYRHRLHTINLFIWPKAKSPEIAIRAFSRQGYHLMQWSSGGMVYWAVSDLNPVDLKTFGELLAAQG